MEDINFNKFVCYILNCISATEDTKVTIFYIDKTLKKSPYDADKSKVDFKTLKYTYEDDAAANRAGANLINNIVAADIPHTILNGDTSDIRKYFNIKQELSYITDAADSKKLNVPQSIFQAFNFIKVFFDAKSWYLQQYKNLQNPISRSNFNFGHDGSMYGGFDIKYDNANKNVADTASYNKFLGNVLKDFIYMITNNTDKIENFDVTTLYVLSKINYYLAKRYAVLSIKNNPTEFYEALNQYSQATAYDNSFFNNFTYYTKEIDDKDYPRYYQKEILELLKTGRPTEDNDVLSYLLTTETNKKIDPIADQITYDNFNKNLKRTEIYKSLFTNEKLFEYNHNEIEKKFNDINSFIDHIKNYNDTYRYKNIDKDKITDIRDEIKIEETEFKYHATDIKNVLVNLTTATIAAITIIKKNMVEIAGAANAARAGTTATGKVDADFTDGAEAAIGADAITIIQIAAAAGGATLKSYGAGAVAGVRFDIDAVINAAKAACDAAAAGGAAGSIKDKAKASLNDDAKKSILKQLIINAIKNSTAIDDIKATVDAAVRAAATVSTAGAIAAFTVIAYIISYTEVITKLFDAENNRIKSDFIDIINIARMHIQNNVANINNINIQSEINTTVCSMSGIKKPFNDLIETINEYKSNHIAVLFKSIKRYIKKYSNNTFSSVYKSPTFTYSVTPINIRPLVYKRATETDLSNYAAQIASDSFINNNQLPTIPDFKSIDKVIGLLGGAPDINNSSNVYRTIFNKILNALNAKRIKLNDDDRDKVNTKLNDLEEIEQYLKSTLSDYAKYASVTHQKGTMVGYNDVRDFLNDYENKLREYNKKSASVVRFIGRLTPYLYSH